MRKIITRRYFMQRSAFALIGTTLGLSLQPEKKSRVVLIRDKDALDQNSVIDGDIVQQMLDEAVSMLLGVKDVKEAFQKLVKPHEIVGIKSNVWSYLPTPRELEKAIEQRLMDVGVKKENIGIDDHTVRTNPIFQKATSLINVRPLRTHYLAGMSGCLKNYSLLITTIAAQTWERCLNCRWLREKPG